MLHINRIVASLEENIEPWPRSSDIKEYWGKHYMHSHITKPSVYIYCVLKGQGVVDEFSQIFRGWSSEELVVFRDAYPLHWFFPRYFCINNEAGFVFEKKTIMVTKYILYDVLLWLRLHPISSMPARISMTMNAKEDSKERLEYYQPLVNMRKALSFTDEEIHRVTL